MAKLIKTKALKEVTGDLRISKDLADALDAKVIDVVKAGIARAIANNRKTILPSDL